MVKIAHTTQDTTTNEEKAQDRRELPRHRTYSKLPRSPTRDRRYIPTRHDSHGTEQDGTNTVLSRVANGLDIAIAIERPWRGRLREISRHTTSRPGPSRCTTREPHFAPGTEALTPPVWYLSPTTTSRRPCTSLPHHACHPTRLAITSDTHQTRARAVRASQGRRSSAPCTMAPISIPHIPTADENEALSLTNSETEEEYASVTRVPSPAKNKNFPKWFQ